MTTMHELFDGSEAKDLDEYPTAPRVSGAPDVVWLNYGDIERDCTHAECYRDGDVTWCEDSVFDSDVQYTRSDLLDALVREAIAAEREACAMVLQAAAERLEPEGKRTNQVDRHVACVLATKADELRMRSNVRAEQ